jgi:hypothetical protein
LRPDALITALAISANNSIQVSNRSVASELIHELRKRFRDGNKRDLVSITFAFWQWQISGE